MDPRLALSGLALGLLAPLALERLAPIGMLVGLAAFAIALATHRRGRFIATILAGFIWASFHHHERLAERLPVELDGERTLLTGVIGAMPEPTATGWRFEIHAAQLVETGQVLPRLRAQWFDGEPVAVGETWQFEAVLRRPRGMSNPGGFDYEAWLYAQAIGGLASVRSGDKVRSAAPSTLAAQRSQLRDRLAGALDSAAASPRLLALVVGDRSVLSSRDWELMQATGTSHLMVISGLHVGLLAATVFLLIGVLGRLGLTPGRWPRLWLAAAPAALVAGIYAALAGFAVPTQRALLMVILVLLARLLYRQPSPWTLWLGALVGVLLLEPAAPLRAGFWLSFMAVGALILGLSGRLAQVGPWGRWGRPQWVIFVGLWPWLVLWGMPGSLVAPAVNALAIPWIAFLVVPSALLASLLCVLLDLQAPLHWAATLLDWMFLALEWTASDIAPVRWAFPGWIDWTLAACAACVLISPLARLLWIPALACLVPLLIPDIERPADGELWVTFLDVGQGLSVLLQTREHDLLYDAGARFHTGFDLGEAVVVPALAARGVRRLDMLMLSHADNDHAGGALAVARALAPRRVVAGQHEALPAELDAEACTPGTGWEWNGVHFETIYTAPLPAPPNERSCVLRVRAAETGLLLPGDLGIRGEYQMLGLDVSADLLLAPHHGSRTSSSYAFIRAVDPGWVVFSAGHNNRYNHPHPRIVDRYRELGVEPVYTARSGASRFVVGAAGVSLVETWRQSSRRFWHEQ